MPEEKLEPILVEAIPLDEPLPKGFVYKSGENLYDIVCSKGVSARSYVVNTYNQYGERTYTTTKCFPLLKEDFKRGFFAFLTEKEFEEFLKSPPFQEIKSHYGISEFVRTTPELEELVRGKR